MWRVSWRAVASLTLRFSIGLLLRHRWLTPSCPTFLSSTRASIFHTPETTSDEAARMMARSFASTKAISSVEFPFQCVSRATVGNHEREQSVSIIGPPGSRSRHLGIKRGMRLFGFVRWGRNHPMNQRKLVRWSRIALWDEMWVFELAT